MPNRHVGPSPLWSPRMWFRRAWLGTRTERGCPLRSKNTVGIGSLTASKLVMTLDGELLAQTENAAVAGELCSPRLQDDGTVTVAGKSRAESGLVAPPPTAVTATGRAVPGGAAAALPRLVSRVIWPSVWILRHDGIGGQVGDVGERIGMQGLRRLQPPV